MISKVLPAVIVGLVALLQATDRVSSITFGECNLGSKHAAKLESVQVIGCEDETYCRMVRGKEASLEVTFTTVKAFYSAKVKVYGRLGFIPLPLSLDPEDACGNYGFDCPVGAGERKTLRLSLPILSTYPKLSVTVQLRLIDEEKRPIVCIEFPAKIVDP